MPSTLADMGRHRFVALTTFRRSGAPVPTPVWVAPVDGGPAGDGPAGNGAAGDVLVVTTPADSGKVKRLRHDPRVELRPCTRLGKVAPDAPTVAAVARVVPADGRSTGALASKYGLEYRIVLLVEKVLRRGGERVILRITEA